jgi:hypothetical protein
LFPQRSFAPFWGGTQHGSDPRDNFYGRSKCVAPDTKNLPTSPSKLPGYASVAVAIAGDLGIPKLAVRFRAPVAAGTTVPEAAINENGNSTYWEGEVGCAWKFQMAAPAGDSVLAKQFH